MGGAGLISEKQFATTHASFWNELLPMAEEYLRTRNRTVNIFGPALESHVPPDRRGIVNEVGFRIYIAAASSRTPLDRLPMETMHKSIRDTLEYLRMLPEQGPTDVSPMTEDEVREAKRLAENLVLFFRRYPPYPARGFPVFPGCGWIEQCQGDILGSKILFEVKAGDRSFRSIDLRQLLIYCALNFASKTFEIEHVCLVNPRLGTFLAEPLQRLCLELGGRSASEVLGDIVRYISEPADQYLTA